MIQKFRGVMITLKRRGVSPLPLGAMKKLAREMK